MLALECFFIGWYDLGSLGESDGRTPASNNTYAMEKASGWDGGQSAMVIAMHDCLIFVQRIFNKLTKHFGLCDKVISMAVQEAVHTMFRIPAISRLSSS